MAEAPNLPGYLSTYLSMLRGADEAGVAAAESLTADMVEIFTSEAGLRVLKLLEKSVLMNARPLGAGDGALREDNAVRNFVLEIRRIVGNG